MVALEVTEEEAATAREVESRNQGRLAVSEGAETEAVEELEVAAGMVAGLERVVLAVSSQSLLQTRS